MNYTSGEKIGNFVVTRHKQIDEIHCSLIELTHIPTGASVMHLGNDDPENFFCLSFQTIPESSNGVAHILEHTVLCGSKKYPVKDPFFLMSRRSLMTFMNAFTGSDFTCYPASTLVKKDFYNLMEVYLDAVFYPNLNIESFRQEGHRFEFEVPDDSETPLMIKGIVYNEMKGAMASSDTRLVDTMQSLLYPDTPYGNNSGGDPKEISTLTYEQLKDFHKKHYHPSRCLFFFYGNFPLKEHLDFIEDKVLNHTSKEDPLLPIPLQPRFHKPHRTVKTYPLADDVEADDKTLISFGWLTCTIKEQDELLALTIIDTALFGNDASPLKQALLKSGLCKQVSSNVDTESYESSYLISLRGCEESQADEIEKILRSTLQTIVDKGIPESLVENAIHQNEIIRSEISENDDPYGLTLFFRAGLLKQHDVDPMSGLMIHSLFSGLRQHIAENPKYLTNLIQKYLLDNTHFVRLTFVPDRGLGPKEHQNEIEQLEKIKSRLNIEEKNQIVKEASELEAFQHAQEEGDEDILPKITLADVPKKMIDYPLHSEQSGSLKVFRHNVFTNGLVYADLIFPLPELTTSELTLVNLFTALLPEIGCGGRNYLENLDFIQANVGRMSSNTSINTQATDYNIFHPYLYIRGKALYRNADKLFTLMRDMASSPDFTDMTRLKEVVFKLNTMLEQNLTRQALHYATNLSASAQTVPARVVNLIKGLDHLLTIRDLARNFDMRKEELVANLLSLKDKLLLLNDAHLAIGCDSKMFEEIKKHRFYGLQDIATKPYQPWEGKMPKIDVQPQGLAIASPVAFIADVIQTVPYIHPSAPALSLAAYIFNNVTIHKLVREKGGAYGGGCSNNSIAGNLTFYSYRDPNIFQTLEAFEKAAKNVESGKFNASDIEEAKLEVIQNFDSPLSPGISYHYAYRWMREGKSLAAKQEYRDRLLAVTKEEIIQAVKEHVIPNLNRGIPIVFAGKELLEKENSKLFGNERQPFSIATV